MEFLEAPVSEAEGAVLAHTYVLGPHGALRKGRRLSGEDVDALARAGIARIFIARLGADDLDEDQAAAELAAAVHGPGTRAARATTGRANLFSTSRGVLVVEAALVDAVNLVDERLTVATRAPGTVVSEQDMVATVKVIPFAVPRAVVAAAAAAAPGPLVRVAPFRPRRSGLVITRLGVSRTAAEQAAEKSQRQRMTLVGGTLEHVVHVPHDVRAVASAIAELLGQGLDLIMVLGASAVVDRQDVVPVAIERAGGVVEHLGMPVDPGNLMLLGRHGRVPVLGVPGCARSLKRSGFDWVLERLAADLPVTRGELMRLGTGGLLAEVEARGAPRIVEPERPGSSAVGAVVLAAGLGRRMGGPNKLLETVGGVPMVQRVVDAVLASRARPVVVVVGHQADAVRAVLEGRAVELVENAEYHEGLGSSLRCGITALATRHHVDGALVVLSDMPFLRPAHVDALIDAFDPAGPLSICVPVHERRRGHPVLWSARHFPELMRCEGDQGARALLERHAELVRAVPLDDSAIHVDVDTAEMLAAARSRGE